MKKILTTLTVIAATALGAQGQSTNRFPNTPTTVSFTNLTFEQVSASVPGTDAYNNVRLLFGITGVTNTATTKVSIYNITLSGQGITGSLTFGDDEPADLTRPSRNIPLLDRFVPVGPVPLPTFIQNWNSTNNLVSFDMDVVTSIPVGAQVYYAVQYAFDSTQVNTAFGNVNLVAVPEPSAYAAAAGLLALFLWSSRRHLFKLAGARSAAASGQGETGAA